jgi:hypothetical protein
MKLTEKLQYIQDHHFSDWLNTRGTVRDDFSNKQSRFCLCGRLATGLHESGCRKFNDAITKETLERLKHLFPQQERKIK